jgi:hypothetical protein
MSPTRSVAARCDLHALRRTPPTVTTPYGPDPPVLRIICSYCGTASRRRRGRRPHRRDKTPLGNVWYPHQLEEVPVANAAAD